MKTLVTMNTSELIQLKEIDFSNHIIVYKQGPNTLNSDKWSYSILHKLQASYKSDFKDKFGFLSLKYTMADPTYTGKTPEEAVKGCMRHRDVKVFNSVEDLLTAILEQEF